MNSSYKLLTTDLFLKNIRTIFFVLTLFSLIVDPTNEILKIKNVSFILFLFTSINKFNFAYIKEYIFLFVMYFFSYSIQLFFPNCFIDAGTSMAILKSFIYLAIIFLMGGENDIPVFKFFFFINLLLAIFCIIIWGIIMLVPSLEIPLYTYFMRNENFAMTISHRVFIGTKVIGVFHKTCVFSVFCLAYSCYIYFFNKQKKYFLYCLVFFFYLFFSGTRANMLSAVLICFGCYAYYQYKKRHLALFSLLLSVGVIVFGIIILLLLNDKGEQSIAIKYQHKISYWQLFDSNPLRYLLIGDGPGSTFFSSGWGKVVVTTELSYYELVRNYGVIFAIIFVLIFLKPLINIYNMYKSKLFFPLTLSFFAYLFIAGTNPYLIGSTGFTSMAIMIYVGNKNINEEMKNE